MRVRVLETIGGYSARFWLDYSDIESSTELHQHGLWVRIAGDLSLQHEMAMLDYDRRMTPARFATFLSAESDFMDLYRGSVERGCKLLRLAARVVHQRSYADLAFARLEPRRAVGAPDDAASDAAGHAMDEEAGAERG